MAKCFLCTYS